MSASSLIRTFFLVVLFPRIIKGGRRFLSSPPTLPPSPLFTPTSTPLPTEASEFDPPHIPDEVFEPVAAPKPTTFFPRFSFRPSLPSDLAHPGWTDYFSRVFQYKGIREYHFLPTVDAWSVEIYVLSRGVDASRSSRADFVSISRHLLSLGSAHISRRMHTSFLQWCCASGEREL